MMTAMITAATINKIMPPMTEVAVHRSVSRIANIAGERPKVDTAWHNTHAL